MYGNHAFFMWMLNVLLLLQAAHICESHQGDPIPRACVPPHDMYPFCNTSLPLDERLDDLISRLTLEEKPYLLVARESPKGNTSRLGIPEYDWGGNCMHGVQSKCAPDGRCPTSFPNPNNLGASFNETLWKAMGSVIGIELRALWLQNVGEKTTSNLPHIGLDCWSPNIDIQRDPRWGRNMETPSEDPFVCGRYGVAYTLGLQNNSLDDRYLQAVATLKHFDANSLEGYWNADGTWGKNAPISRHSVNATISMYDLYSSYLPSFKAAVVEGGAAGIMCSFNSINGVPSCANHWLLQTVLRDEWKFRGYVTSDTGALIDLIKYYNFTTNWTDTVSATISAGCDVESAAGPPHQSWSTGGQYIDNLPNAVKEGLIDETVIDCALRNALGIRFRLGLFDPIENQPFWHVSPDVVQNFEHMTLAKEATAQGFVLLKNDNNLLPLDPRKRYAVVGPHANDRTAMLGNYFGEICANDGNNECVTSFYEAIEATVNMYKGSAVNATGCNVNDTSKSGFQSAIDAAKRCDIVVFIGGINLRIEGEANDRYDIRLPQIQRDLLKEVQVVNSNVVLVLLHGGMLAVEDLLAVKALISTGYPGRYGAEALSNAIFGLTTKAWGKLPVTWYASSIVNELNMVNFDMSKAPGRTYRYYTGEPVFKFGHGLNPLTNFTIELLETRCNLQRIIEADTTCTINIRLSNVGPSRGDEVILAFFRPTKGVIPSSEPASNLQKQLFGFQRINLPVDSSKTVSFEVSSRTLRLFDSYGKPALFPGTYVVEITNGNDAFVAELVNLQVSDSISNVRSI